MKYLTLVASVTQKLFGRILRVIFKPLLEKNLINAAFAITD